MKIRGVLVCDADYPSDFLDDGKEITRPDGLNITLDICSFFEKIGAQTSEPEADLEHHAWNLFITWKGRKFWLLISFGDELVIFTQEHTPIFKSLFKGSSMYIEFLKTLQNLLSTDEKFTNFLWYEIFDVAHQGYSSPVDTNT